MRRQSAAMLVAIAAAVATACGTHADTSASSGALDGRPAGSELDASSSSAPDASASSACPRPTLLLQSAGETLPVYVEEGVSTTTTTPCEGPSVQGADAWVVVRDSSSALHATKLAKYRVRSRLQALEGIASVTLVAGTESRVVVRVDARRRAELGLGLEDVTRAMTAQRIELPAGRVESGGRETSVRVMGRPDEAASLRELVIVERDGAPIRLENIANVELGARPISTFRLPPPNGDAHAVLAVRFKSATRRPDISRELGDLARELPPGVTARLVD